MKMSYLLLRRPLVSAASLLLVLMLAACGDPEETAPAGEAPEVDSTAGVTGSLSAALDTLPPDPELDSLAAGPRFAPDFVLETLSGEPFQLAEHEGEVVLLNFWATWCAPCRMEIPDLIELQEAYGDDGLQIVGISVDAEGFEAVRPFAEEMGMNYPVVVDIGELSEMYGGVYALPTTFLIDREGRIARKVAGLITRKEIEPQIRELLGMPAS